jgi:hypothetical protein
MEMAPPVGKDEQVKDDLAKLDELQGDLVGALQSAVSLVELLFAHSGSVADRLAQSNDTEDKGGEQARKLEPLRAAQLAVHGADFLERIGRVQSGIDEHITRLDNFVPIEYTAYRERLDADLEEEKLRHVLGALGDVVK